MRQTSADRAVRPAAILAIVGFGVFVAADDLTVVSTMLRPIIGDLGIPLPDGLDRAAWIVNAYLIAYVAVMPIAGRLSDVVGRRAVFVGALAVFLVGSVWIPLADTFGWFLAGRVISAIGGGALVPVSLAVVGDIYPVGKRGAALGTLTAIDSLGWVWGPLYGAMLVRFLSWEWQFYLNIPLAIAGMVVAWRVLGRLERPAIHKRFDFVGAGALAVGLVAFSAAFLNSARIQTVTGLEELTGATGTTPWWLYVIGAGAIGVFVWSERRAPEPVFDRSFLRSRDSAGGLVVNFLLGAALVVAVVDVPLFVNVVEVDLERSAVISGWVLTSLTLTMAAGALAGGRATTTWRYRGPTLVGVGLAIAGYVAIGAQWSADTAYLTMAWQLALIGTGIGIATAPTTTSVIDTALPERRGAAAAAVIVLRLMGLAVGLAALTAWGLHRFNVLRGEIVLPPIGSPEYEAAARIAQTELTTAALAETFTAAAVVLVAAVAAAAVLSGRAARLPDV